MWVLSDQHGEMVYLWRAVDREGEVLESYVTRTRDKKAALAFMKKALGRHGLPKVIITDGVRSYKAAMIELGSAGKQEVGRHANNRVENNHLSQGAIGHATIRIAVSCSARKYLHVHPAGATTPQAVALASSAAAGKQPTTWAKASSSHGLG